MAGVIILSRLDSTTSREQPEMSAMIGKHGRGARQQKYTPKNFTPPKILLCFVKFSSLSIVFLVFLTNYQQIFHFRVCGTVPCSTVLWLGHHNWPKFGLARPTWFQRPHMKCPQWKQYLGLARRRVLGGWTGLPVEGDQFEGVGQICSDTKLLRLTRHAGGGTGR